MSGNLSSRIWWISYAQSKLAIGFDGVVKDLAKKGEFSPTAEMWAVMATFSPKIAGECDRLEPAIGQSVERTIQGLGTTVFAWKNASVKIDDVEAAWFEYDQIVLFIADVGKLDGYTKRAKKLQRRFSRAKRPLAIRQAVARHLYTTWLRGMVSVESVKASGRNGEVLHVRRASCGGTFNSIALGQYSEIIDMGGFQSLKCTSKYGGKGSIVPLDN